ncbi:MAG: hypothetical protein IJX99_10130 [Clostridia bacterium]|nr:hypothetical protein [Clostridia bacterium]
MFDLDKEIAEWKQLLIAGEIDGATYNAALQKLAKKDQRIKDRKKIVWGDLLVNLLVLGIILIIVFMILYFVRGAREEEKNVKYVSSLRDLPGPVQIKTTGGTVKEVDGEKIEITYLAEYSISGRVVDVQAYGGYGLGDKLSPRDFGMTWGFLANPENNINVKWSSMGTRSLNLSIKDNKWVNSVGGWKKINEHLSNNHIIPSDKSVEKLIKKVETNDYIKLDGYLVKIYSNTDDGGFFKWGTSLSRTDQGDGACEVIYVTDIAWLMEK